MPKKPTVLESHSFQDQTNINVFTNDLSTNVIECSLLVKGKTKDKKIAVHKDPLLLYKEGKRMLKVLKKQGKSDKRQYCYTRLQEVIKRHMTKIDNPDFYATNDTLMIVGLFVNVDKPYAIMTRWDDDASDWVDHYTHVTHNTTEAGKYYTATFWNDVKSYEIATSFKPKTYDLESGAAQIVQFAENLRSSVSPIEEMIQLELALLIKQHEIFNGSIPSAEWVYAASEKLQLKYKTAFAEPDQTDDIDTFLDSI
ncbi:hypothetical protein C9I86_03555 [Photobacterium sp. NCIMB 13483]|uniref:hypothetical protein n=1 Tax=Photobacterium sp. NCIMB 13483 TaxID=2022103 RepID=UPI000D178114|nr:hypothetical protein [Photobacterium sp. NCIMB 13483]PST94437.1 hypothetical protein C9I86_03555 [Photobacterium sp. NCIMB 13483]